MANTRAAAARLADAGAEVREVTLPWDIEAIKRAARIHFGMIFGASMREIYAAHAESFTSYARRFVAESDEIAKDDFVAGLALEADIYAPLGQLLDNFDALVCPTFAVPALPAEYDTDQPAIINGREHGDWLDVLMTLPFNIASRCPVLSVPSGRSARASPPGCPSSRRPTTTSPRSASPPPTSSNSHGSTRRSASPGSERRLPCLVPAAS